jgi:hypothetical protein
MIAGLGGPAHVAPLGTAGRFLRSNVSPILAVISVLIGWIPGFPDPAKNLSALSSRLCDLLRD